MKVQENGKGQTNLSKRNFVASGGEGSVYVHAGRAYKIYTDPKKMIPSGKIAELSTIMLPNIIKPEGVLTLSGKKKPIGYTMRYVADTVALCPIFTKGFKKRNNVTPDMAFNLAWQLKEGVQHVHSNKILVVDLNETNFLVDKKFSTVYFIDVDSYQTPNHPATALMDSVKDWHAKGIWTEGSDWFSWGIISFQLLVGIHPYKGKHPSMNMEQRMQGNVSVFNPKVSVPKVAESFDIIPQAYRDWYKAVFEDGVRVAPPTALTFGVTTTVAAKPIVSSAHLNITDIWEAGKPIRSYHHAGPWDACISTDGELRFGKNKQFSRVGTTEVDYVFSAAGGELIGGKITGSWLELCNMESGVVVPPRIQCKNAMVYHNRLYIQSQEQILEAEVESIGGSLATLETPVANVMRNSTTMFDGIVIQNMLGAWWTNTFPESGKSYESRLLELDGHRIIDAKYRGSVLIVIGQKNGKYDRFIYLEGPVSHKFTLFNQELNISYQGINFTILDNGVCVVVDENEDILLFASHPHPNIFKKIKDPAISGDMTLHSRGDEVLFCHEKSLKKVSMR